MWFIARFVTIFTVQKAWKAPFKNIPAFQLKVGSLILENLQAKQAQRGAGVRGTNAYTLAKNDLEISSATLSA